MQTLALVRNFVFAHAVSSVGCWRVAALALVRNFVFAHAVSSVGCWRVADVAARAFDLEGMHVGTVATGPVGLAVMRRLKPFGVRLHYADRHRLPKPIEVEVCRRAQRWRPREAATARPHCKARPLRRARRPRSSAQRTGPPGRRWRRTSTCSRSTARSTPRLSAW
jgi:formate dehydrogenase